MKYLILVGVIYLSCNTTPKEPQTPSVVITPTPHKALDYVDSFIAVNLSMINKSKALRQYYETECTKLMLPLIDKKGYYEDLPFKLTGTAEVSSGFAGKFEYENQGHSVKVLCIIPKSLLVKLEDENRYFIKFKLAEFRSGVTFRSLEDETKTELPYAYGQLLSVSQTRPK